MPPISLLIKPASSSCNLRCKYCFYHSIAENRSTKSYGVMSTDIMENVIKKALSFADEICTFAFQGGEPTIAGLDFYKKFVELVKVHNVKNVKVDFNLQTNGTTIDETWADFLSQNNFLVGLSLDGPSEINNLHRVNTHSDGTFNKIMKTVDLFNKFKVEYNILYVVTSHSARAADKIYKFFKKNNFKYLQFISCLDPINEARGQHPYSLKPHQFENFLKITFDRWYEDFAKGEYISIRYFDNLVRMILGHKPEACNMNGVCSCHCVVEADGGVYPCDFYVIDKWKLGNIKENEIVEMITSDTSKKFIQDSIYVAPECKMCKWFGLCKGGCRREREAFEKDSIELNYFCSAYKGFFEYAYPRLLNVARIVSARRQI